MNQRIMCEKNTWYQPEIRFPIVYANSGNELQTYGKK